MPGKESNHFLDLKLPLGALLSFYGVVLGLYGIFSDPSVYTKSFHINVNRESPPARGSFLSRPSF